MAKEASLARVSFIGDISLNNRYTKLYDQGEKPFQNISREFQDSDLVVGNLECLAKGDKGFNKLKNPRLNTDLRTLNFLKDLRLGLVSLAHNHVYDNLEDGFEKTTDFLKEKGISYVGAGTTSAEASKPTSTSINGLKFTFLNYVTQDTNPNLPEDAGVHLNWFDEKRIVQDISNASTDSDFIILLMHWSGDTEHHFYPNLKIPRIAEKFLSKGADLVIGHHTHTFQPFEVLDGKYSFYSLGNFCFDDIETETKVFEIDRRRESDSFIVHVDFGKKDYKVACVPIYNDQCTIKYNPAFTRVYERRITRFKWMKRIAFVWKLNFWFFRKTYPITKFLFGNGKGLSVQLKKITFRKIANYLSWR